jgi:hypothetical protein
MKDGSLGRFQFASSDVRAVHAVSKFMQCSRGWLLAAASPAPRRVACVIRCAGVCGCSHVQRFTVALRECVAVYTCRDAVLACMSTQLHSLVSGHHEPHCAAFTHVFVATISRQPSLTCAASAVSSWRLMRFVSTSFHVRLFARCTTAHTICVNATRARSLARARLSLAASVGAQGTAPLHALAHRRSFAHVISLWAHINKVPDQHAHDGHTETNVPALQLVKRRPRGPSCRSQDLARWHAP